MKLLSCDQQAFWSTVRYHMRVEGNKTMSNLSKLSAILACTLLIGVVGCKPKPVAAPKPEPKASDGPLLAPPQPAAPATPQADNEEKTDAAKIKANLASLSTEDRALAEKQKIC